MGRYLLNSLVLAVLSTVISVSFNVMAGETVCILGRSGVGKSVSLMNIMGFLKPDSGRVIVAYEDITDYGEEDLERIRKKVTIVFQNGALFDSLTVGENVAFPLRERRQLVGARRDVHQRRHEAGVELGLADFDRISAGVPLLADLKPSGRFVATSNSKSESSAFDSSASTASPRLVNRAPSCCGVSPISTNSLSQL